MNETNVPLLQSSHRHDEFNGIAKGNIEKARDKMACVEPNLLRDKAEPLGKRPQRNHCTREGYIIVKGDVVCQKGQWRTQEKHTLHLS